MSYLRDSLIGEQFTIVGESDGRLDCESVRWESSFDDLERLIQYRLLTQRIEATEMMRMRTVSSASEPIMVRVFMALSGSCVVCYRSS
jgi:hypothetical protein